LEAALESATAGDTVTVAPGTYRLDKVNLRANGRVDAPIRVIAAKAGEVVIHTTATELFKVTGAHWTIQGLDIRGGSQSHHALHIAGDADGVKVLNNRFRGFHSTIKGNGQGTPREYPDGVEIRRNVFMNPSPRRTDAPVTLIDVVGGADWRITDNLIADFAKDGGDGISYGAFLKGNSRNGVFARNLVVCAWHHTLGERVGLSFGGGGSSAGKRGPEHTGGQMINNIIVNCGGQPGIYLNKAKDTIVAFNTIYNSAGIDARFQATDTTIANNLLTGAILVRNGASVERHKNYEAGTRLAYYLPAAARKLAYRISDYHVKFPNYVSKSQVSAVQRMILGAATWLTRSPVALGGGAFRDMVGVGSDQWFQPLDVDRLQNAGTAEVRTALDFCTRERLVPGDIGAIEYESGACDVAAVLEKRFGPFIEPESLDEITSSPKLFQ
jgi:hypothetical protein